MSEARGTTRDPGLQPERTRLAWRRTTLASTVVVILAVRALLHGGMPAVGVVAGALCCLLWLCFLWLAHRRIHALAAPGQPVSLTPRHAAAATLCTVAVAVCAAVLVL
ncbi:DUF202 domain-containing protein [Streptomyces cavernae]|uniref:DUF202 domain-containing protein n=1 Tax=Streptomyces cavernae TaxID=2259034 RepID=UPI000FEBA9D6|nr:DUF202 domain-containing protein [Streptomyces cavernae]